MAHGQQMLVERVNEYTNTQMIGRYKVRNDKYHRDNRIIVAYIYQDYLLHAFVSLFTFHAHSYPWGKMSLLYYFTSEETEIQRSGVASTALSRGARKGEARIQTQINYPRLMLLTATMLTVEWLPARGLQQTMLLCYPYNSFLPTLPCLPKRKSKQMSKPICLTFWYKSTFPESFSTEDAKETQL